MKVLLVFLASLMFLSYAYARPVQTSLMCESWHDRYNTCEVRGEILEVDLVARYSHNRCIPGFDWGYMDNFVWVDNGCRATFRVVYKTVYMPPPPPPHPYMVTCSAVNLRGQVFTATEEDAERAQLRALARCNQVSLGCRAAGCDY